MVVLTAQLEVAEHNCDLSASDYQDEEHNEEETKDVVKLVQPYGGKDEKQLNKDCPKREYPSNENGECRVHVPSLFWDLSWDFVSLHRVLNCWLLKPKIAAYEDKRN